MGGNGLTVNIELCVICVAIELDNIFLKKRAKWKEVNNNNGALKNIRSLSRSTF